LSRAGETLSPERAALVLVDLQEKLLPAMRQSDRVLKAACTFLELAKVLELPVVLTTQYRKGLWPQVPAVIERGGGVEPVD